MMRKTELGLLRPLGLLVLIALALIGVASLFQITTAVSTMPALPDLTLPAAVVGFLPPLA